MRDVRLDAIRGYTMMYIICFIHLVYPFLPYTSNAVSLILVEMPVLFFVSGASARLSRPKSFWQLLTSRIRRVLLPYYVYAALSLVVIFIFGLASYSFGLRDFLAILLARDIPCLPYAMHLWFIVPYLIISVSFHFQRRLASEWGGAYLLLVVALVVCTDLALNSQLANYQIVKSACRILLYLLCYNVFFVAGFVCYRRVSTRKTVIVMMVAALLLVLLSKGRIPDFQMEKFPPSTLFMLYGIVSLSALSLIARHIRLPYPPIAAFWNRHCYTIYLYQSYGMWFFASFIGSVILTQWPWWAVLIVGTISLFVINTVLALIISAVSRTGHLCSGLTKKDNRATKA